jgi:hypothetical protein
MKSFATFKSLRTKLVSVYMNKETRIKQAKLPRLAATVLLARARSRFQRISEVLSRTLLNTKTPVSDSELQQELVAAITNDPEPSSDIVTDFTRLDLANADCLE